MSVLLMGKRTECNNHHGILITGKWDFKISVYNDHVCLGHLFRSNVLSWITIVDNRTKLRAMKSLKVILLKKRQAYNIISLISYVWSCNEAKIKVVQKIFEKTVHLWGG